MHFFNFANVTVSVTKNVLSELLLVSVQNELRISISSVGKKGSGT